jgi:hypothetical protein
MTLIRSVAIAVAITGFTLLPPSWTLAAGSSERDEDLSVNLEVFTPRNGDLAGLGGRGLLVDLKAEFNSPLDATGVSPELTGPGVHANAAPLPGTFGNGANADHFPGLVVLMAPNRGSAGAGQNVANLFNITTITNRRADRTEVWATWIVAASANPFGVVGQNTSSHLFVAVVDGVAPDVVVDADQNGIVDEKDLELMGVTVISNVVKRDFTINGF